MRTRFMAGGAVLVLGLGFATGASAMNLQPGMLTMMQQGGQKHGVQSGCVLPGYDALRSCSAAKRTLSGLEPSRRNDSRRPRSGRS